MSKAEQTMNGQEGEETVRRDMKQDDGFKSTSEPMADSGDTREIARSNTQFNHFRYIIITLGGIMMGSMLFLRVNITIAMISMVNKTAIYLIEHPNSTAEEYFAPDYVERGEFIWNNEIQQIIMTGYMLAYTIPQTFTTRLAMKYGVRPSIAISLALCSISNLLTPIMAYWGWQWVLFLRLINALGASAIIPTMVNVIEEFMPYKEASIGVAIFQFVSNTMYTFTPLVSGFLTSINWKWAFNVPGLVGLIICLIWYVVASDTPQQSRFVGQKELDLINGYSTDPTKQVDESDKKTKKRTDLPWYFMFKIRNFYFMSLIWALYCATIGGFLFLLPTYLNRVLSVPVEEVGVLNFTVQIGHMFSMLWPGPFTSFLERKFNMSLTAARRTTAFICTLAVVGTYSYLGYTHNHLVIVIAINRFFHMTNDTIVMQTLMSQYGKAGVSGLVYSMMNALGNLSTVFYCWAIGKFLDYTGESLECWSWILYSLSSLMVMYFIIYAVFCHSNPITIPESKKDEVDAIENGQKC